MKKLLYILLLLFSSVTAISQSRMTVSWVWPDYPTVIGESRLENLIVNPYVLPTDDIIQDSLPHYEIEQIPEQTVRFLEGGMGFYVTADSLHSTHVVYNYEVDGLLSGRFYFNSTTGRFKFYPDASDHGTFTVTFTASSESNSISQAVEFNIMPEVVPENLAIQSLGEMPSSQVYTIIAKSHTEMFFNNATRTVFTYSISGKEIIFDNHLQNQVWGLSGREDLYELNIFAETVRIRTALLFPHTNVNIHARKLIFEDSEDEIASINTTPSAIGLLTNETGMDGESAGNITLNIMDFSANFALRFILNGAQGQCANRNGIPGNGGNGGVFRAPINIGNYGDYVRGSAGVRYDVDDRALTEHGPVIGAGHPGENGHFELDSRHYSWIHPYYVAAVIRHINDSYLNNYFNYSKTTANDYYLIIKEYKDSNEWEELDMTLKTELQDQLLELEGLVYRLNENLDYFGNPLGWVPRLSVEYLMNVFESEIERAIPTLFLYYWLQHVDQTMESWSEACRIAAEETQREIAATQAQINSLREDIPVLEDRIAVLQSQIETTRTRLEQIQSELLRKARHNVKKRNRINKAFGIFKAALNCVPILGGVAGGVASTIGTVAGFAADYFDIADSYGYGDALSGVFDAISGFDLSAALGVIQQAVDNIDLSDLGQTGHELSNSYHQIESIIGPIYSSISNLHQVMAQSSAPNSQVQAEFDRLCSQSPDYQNIKAEIASLEQDYQEFATILTQTFVDIVNLTSEVSNELVSLDALRRDTFESNSKRDLQAMQCVEKMRQRAMNRLVKYHYYMRKAYEYRLLKPYQGEFNLETMYDRLEAMIDQGQVVFNETTPVSSSAYSALAALFEEELSGIIEDVVDELTYHEPEQTATIPIVISSEALDKINSNEDYILNLYELGAFSPDEENLRIVGFDVQHLEAHIEGNGGMTTYMDIELMHKGISRFRKNGEVYWFNLDSRIGTDPHIWAIRYNPLSQETTSIGPSFAEQSLLYSLLNGEENNMMLFTRRSAWSDIVMSKKVHSTGDADIVIDSLVLSLQYDFTRRPNEIRNIDIATNNDLLPYITCSEVDRNGRSNGKGGFHRSYNRSNGTVTFSAPPKYGTYHFVNWTDRQGNVVAESPELTINKQTDQFYRANFERRIPVISVADTIYVGSEGGEYHVLIQNIGTSEIEMDWYVDDSLSTWVHLNGPQEGIDDGYFTFVYEPLRSQKRRIDSLEILAPEIEGMSKMVYIVQHDDTFREVSASIDPIGAGFVSGTGFYEMNDTVTLVATPLNNCEFVSWEMEGQTVSTQPVYNTIITDNLHLVAHFKCEDRVSVTTEVIPENAGTIAGIGLTNGSGLFEIDNEVTITAIAHDNCRFLAWEYNGQIVSTQPQYTFVATNDIHLVARFECEGLISVRAVVVPENSGFVAGVGTYNVGDVVTLKAYPVIPYSFDTWLYNDVPISNNDTYTFIANRDVDYVVKFRDGTGINEDNRVDVKIYPNPTNGIVYIQCEEMEYIEVFSLSGVEEMTTTVKGQTITCFDMSCCLPGLHYLRIITSRGCVIQKVIIL